jgi:L-threonylcarbamoyladenylate synthase
MLIKRNNWCKIKRLYQSKKIIVLPTDTIYALSCLAEKATIELISSIYQIKKRDRLKPLPILFGTWKEAQYFLDLNESEISYLQEQQKKSVRPITFILSIKKKTNNFFLIKYMNFFHCNTVAFRIIKNFSWLSKLLTKIGPIYATSCNLSFQKPIKSTQSIVKFLKIKYVISGKTQSTLPSIMYDVINQKKVRK